MKYTNDCKQRPADVLACKGLACLPRARLGLRLGDVENRSEAAAGASFVKQCGITPQSIMESWI